MIIQDSAVDLFSRHMSSQRVEVHESLQIRAGGDNNQQTSGLQSDQIHISIRARHYQQAYFVSAEQLNVDQLSRERLLADPKNLIKILLLEAMNGGRIQFSSLHISIEINALQLSVSDGAAATDQAGFGLTYDYSETFIDEESMQFSATGSVRLASGETIDFSTELMMHREFRSTASMHLQIGDPIDPLAINFSGGAIELNDEKHFAFDLDSDGQQERLAHLGANSAFLALDRNGDGVINNGSELFGPQSGQGFDELAAFDADGNGWIDEADSVYEQLRFWNPQSDTLATMQEKGVGAIYLDSVESPFMMVDQEYEAQALVRASSIYLSESGMAGTIQQVDLLT